VNRLSVVSTIQNWDEAVLASATSVLSSIGNFLPALVGAVVILVVGFIAANLVGALITRLLLTLRFNQVADKAEINRFISNAGVGLTAVEIVGQLGYWFVLITGFLAAADTLGLHQVSSILANILFYIPNVIVAIVIIVAGVLVADLLSNLVRGAVRTASSATGVTLARITKWSVLTFVSLLALEQLGIAQRLIETLFTGFVAAFAIAFGLAFGLGGQRWASGVLDELTRRGEEAVESRKVVKQEFAKPELRMTSSERKPVRR
jgi:Conserved TM helix